MDIAGGRRRRTVAPSAPPAGGRRDLEEDLTLFKEMVRREKDRNVSLLQPVSVEFEQPAAYNGIYPYPLYRIPSRKQGFPQELLPGEGEKNDYDWLKTPPATPLFPSLEMEANNPNLVILQREIALLQHPGPSRFAGKSEEPRPINRQKHPAAPSSTSSSRTANPAAPTAYYKSPQTAELKREAERRRGGRPAPRGREEVALGAAAGGVNGGAAAAADVGKLVLGSRMVEKVVNARAAAAAGGGGREKGVQPNGGGGGEGHPGRRGSCLPPDQSSHDMVVKHSVGTRKKPVSYVRQKQEHGCPKSLAPMSNRPAPASSTPGETPGHESKEERNLLKKGIGRRRSCALC